MSITFDKIMQHCSPVKEGPFYNLMNTQGGIEWVNTLKVFDIGVNNIVIDPENTKTKTSDHKIDKYRGVSIEDICDTDINELNRLAKAYSERKVMEDRRKVTRDVDAHPTIESEPGGWFEARIRAIRQSDKSGNPAWWDKPKPNPVPGGIVKSRRSRRPPNVDVVNRGFNSEYVTHLLENRIASTPGEAEFLQSLFSRNPSGGRSNKLIKKSKKKIYKKTKNKLKSNKKSKKNLRKNLRKSKKIYKNKTLKRK
jgi:hypothetical protein